MQHTSHTIQALSFNPSGKSCDQGYSSRRLPTKFREMAVKVANENPTAKGE